MSLESVSEILGGQMSEGEVEFCRQVRNRLHEVLEGRHDFHSAVVDLLRDLQKIRGTHEDLLECDVDAASKSGFAVGSIRSPGGPSSPPLSKAEREFVEDMDGLLDYATRNGVNFWPVFGMIWHDISELQANGFRLEGAPFRPQVSGYAKRNTAMVGDVEPEME